VSKVRAYFEGSFDAVRKAIVYVRDSKDELKKVTWPSRDEVTSFTIVVVVTVVFLSLFLWLVDTGLVFLIQYVTK
jgi:preprotein translocase subunit SecE